MKVLCISKLIDKKNILSGIRILGFGEIAVLPGLPMEQIASAIPWK